MAKTEDLFKIRKTLDEICEVPEKIISVYSLEKHVWSDSNSERSRKSRAPELRTVEEFQLDPVRPFLTDILRNMAAPYKREKKDNPIGQGYWIQAEFGSGKSHLLCLLSALALGNRDAWEIIKSKENKAGRGKRESLYQFWEEGLQSKNTKSGGIFVVVKTLVGAGGGVVGLSDKGQKLSEYILDAVKEQLLIERDKNLSLYPAELLADRFIKEDLHRYKTDLKKFLKDPGYFDEDEFEEADDFIKEIQLNKSPEYKRSCGNKLWRFYTEYLKVQPHIEAETEDILENMVEVILSEGYCGVLIVLDEVSLFMKNRDENQRIDDEKTLVVLSNRLGKIHNLPVWTVCAAQQAIESKMGVKNIIADDRLKLVQLLQEDKDYYDIVLSRVREIKDIAAISNYYIHYKRGFSWPNSIGQTEFTHFFPFHKPAVEVLRALTYELTTTRSAIHFMHQTLKHQIKSKGNELIRLWELFDEAVRYEEDPSGVHAGLVAIKTKKEHDYKIYELCKRQIDSLTKGILKFNRDKAIKILQTLFLYHIARTRQQGITPEEIANSVLIEKDREANPEENNQHYETIADNLKKELRQIVQTFDEDHRSRYRFDPVFTGIDPREEFRRARDEAEGDEVMKNEALSHLIALKEWPVLTRHMSFDMSYGVSSIFCDIAPAKRDDMFVKHGNETIDITWNGRAISGLISMRDLLRAAVEHLMLPPIESAETERDFAVFISTKPVSEDNINEILKLCKDPRIILWTPASLTKTEEDCLIDFAACRKLVSTWQGKDTEDAVAVINWVSEKLKTELGKMAKVVDGTYGRGRMDALNNTNMDFRVAGELTGILSPVVDRVLTSVYLSTSIKFEPPFIFRKEEGVKVINGIVKTGNIPKGAKPNQNINAAQNFSSGLKLLKKSSDRDVDISANEFAQDMWKFIDGKLTDDSQTMKITTLYKNFMGMGVEKNYGLSSRMVQIYLLCLVQKGKIKIILSPKSGLSFSILDYSNIGDIDFSVKILDSFLEIQKMSKPEGWEVLVPFAEKLLDEKIPVTSDDSEISKYRKKLRDLFVKEKEKGEELKIKGKSLFEILSVTNPYETEFTQMTGLFTSTEMKETYNDINKILYSLKEIFGYKAFDRNNVDQSEIDDFTCRLKNYRDIKRFINSDMKLRTLKAYCNYALPDMDELKEVKNIQKKLSEKLSNLKSYIDFEVKLKTELIGNFPAVPGEKDTLEVLIRDYKVLYISIHDKVIDMADKACGNIRKIMDSDEFKAFKELENITALQPSVSEKLSEQLEQLSRSLFRCSSSRNILEDQLNREPFDKCGLQFHSVINCMDEIKEREKQAVELVNETLNHKMEVFTSSSVRTRLEQGKTEPVIKALLECENISDIREYLIKSVLADPSAVKIINRYLKEIVIKQVKLSGFKPGLKTVEKEQIPVLVKEFQKYLEKEIKSIESGDTIPVLQLE